MYLKRWFFLLVLLISAASTLLAQDAAPGRDSARGKGAARLKDSARQLKEVEVHGHLLKKDKLSTVVTDSISGKELAQKSGLSLGEALKSMAGVNVLQNGPTVFKPIIHGVYSNRILIVNNGVRQEGQTWGNDHAPEIDPFIATRLTVIKGPASIRYGSDAVGGVILVEPKEMPTTPGISGNADLVGMSNGQAGIASGRVDAAAGGKLKGLSFRLQGTIKHAGDVWANNPAIGNYYVGNTGYREGDFSATVRYAREDYGAEVYFSQFDTKIGIASASHIGSVQDLLSDIARGYPAVISGYSDTIGRPYQRVNHQLLKADAFLKMGRWGRLDGVFARQVDTRREWDADVSFNDSIVKANIPDLYFQLISHTADLIWSHPSIGRKVTGSLGLNFITQGNVQEGLGYQELIPNFRNYGGGAFLIEKTELGKLTLEAGLRYDYRWLRAYTLDSRTLALRTPTYDWQRVTVNAGAIYHFSEYFSADYNFGSAWRPPQVIELFANGIHQSAVSYEHGDSTLTLETAYNNTLSFTYNKGPLVIEAGGYINYFNHYIYLRPDAPHVQSTIQGVFPSFTYIQTNALFEGFDLTVNYEFLKHLYLISRTSVVRARDLTSHDWLIDIPSDKFDNTLKYELPVFGKRMKDVFVSINNLAVTKQTRVPTKIQDYAPPPDGYVMWGASAGISFPYGQHAVSVSFTVNNLTNVSYRDYLDKFRYFINGMGRNAILRVSASF